MPLEALLIQFREVVGTQVRIGLLLFADVIEEDEGAVSHSHDGLLTAARAGQTVELGAKGGIGRVRDGPDDLPERRTQPGMAACRRATESLAGALAVARADSCPGG